MQCQAEICPQSQNDTPSHPIRGVFHTSVKKHPEQLSNHRTGYRQSYEPDAQREPPSSGRWCRWLRILQQITIPASWTLTPSSSYQLAASRYAHRQRYKSTTHRGPASLQSAPYAEPVSVKCTGTDRSSVKINLVISTVKGSHSVPHTPDTPENCPRQATYRTRPSPGWTSRRRPFRSVWGG